MKAKIKRGSGFRGALNYVLSKDEPRVVGGNMSGQSPRELAKEFTAARMLRPDIEKPVWHSSLSAAPGERLTDQQWHDVAARYMKGMGFSELTQYVVVRHTPLQDQLNPPEPTFDKNGKPKKAGPECEHVHIVASRIGLDGKVWLGQNDVHLAIEQTQQIEWEFDLVRTKGYDGPKDKKALTRGEAGMAMRTEEMAPREYLQHTIAGIVATKPTIGEFIDKAQAAGIELRANVASTGRMNGFSFSRDGIHFSGQQLGAQFKWGTLQKSIDYQPERDTALLQHIGPRAAGKTLPAPSPLVSPVAARGTAPAPKANPAPLRIQKLGKLPRSLIPKGIAQWARDAIKTIEGLAKALERFRQEIEQSYWMHQQIQRAERARVAAQARANIARPAAPKVAPAPAPAKAEESQTQVAKPPSPAAAGASVPQEIDKLRRLVDLAIEGKKGIHKSDALARAASAADSESVDRLLEAEAVVLPKALDAAAKSGDEAIFKKLVGADGTATDAGSLRDLASKCGPEARAKLNALAAQAKAQGSIEGLGIDPPPQPGAQVGTSTKLVTPS